MDRLAPLVALAAFTLSACGSKSPSGTVDAAITGDASPHVDAMNPVVDAAGPSGVDCFYEWGSHATCGPPVIDAAYLTNDCEATTGVFIAGHGFESANLFMVNNGWMPYGPQVLSSRWNGDFWNVLTPTFMCVTTSADPGTWSGFAVQLKNPDGQLSNTVTIANLLNARPPLPSTDSNDPFDPDACLEAGMTRDQALATFAMGASSSTLGVLTVVQRTRSCNTATGCLPWNAPTNVATGVSAGLALATGGSNVDFTLGGHDCGVLGAIDETLSYNDCQLNNSEVGVHVAAHCLRLSSTERSQVAGDGGYTQTDTAALLRY